MSKNSNVYCCLFDACKAFDKVHIGKLFNIVVVVYSGVRLKLPIAMHIGIIKRNTQCMYR